MFNDKTTACLLESCSSHFSLLNEAVKASKNTALYIFIRSTAGVEHPQYGCIRRVTIKGYYILFKDCAAYHGPGWESSRAGDSLDSTWQNLCVMGLLCSCITSLIHVAICIEALQIHTIWSTSVIHHSEFMFSFFFQLKAFTFLWHTGKNSLPTTNLLSHTHSSSLKKSGCCYSVKLWVFQNSFLILLLSSSLANSFPPSANYTWAMTWSIQYQLFASLQPHTSWLQCTGG